MHNNRRVVVVCPAGRRESMSLLYPYLKRFQGLVDEFRVCSNTSTDDDLAYLASIKSDPFVNMFPSAATAPFSWLHSQYDEYFSGFQPKSPSIPQFQPFYQSCTNSDTVYIKIDDDVIFWEPQALKNLVEFRIQHPEFFLVSGNVINNGVTAYLHQRIGAIPPGLPDLVSSPLTPAWDNASYRSSAWAETQHSLFTERYRSGETRIYDFGTWLISPGERFSANCVAWLGEEFAKFGGIVPAGDDEAWLVERRAKEVGKSSCILGSAIFCHLAFDPQRQQKLKTKVICDAYRSILNVR